MEVETGVRDQIKNLRNEARSNRAARECILTINGRECKVTANPVITGWWIFKRIAKTEITIEFSTLDSRKCEVQFVYNRGRGVNQGIENFIEKLQEIPSAEAGDPKGSQAVPERATTETQPDSGGTSKSTDTSESTDHTSVPSAEVGGSKDSPVTESATVDTTPDSGGTSESTDHTSVPSAEAGGPKGSQAVPESATVESPTGSGGTSESSKPTSVSSTEVGGPKGSQAIPESATVESPTGSGGTSESSKPTSVSSTEVGGPKGSQAVPESATVDTTPDSGGTSESSDLPISSEEAGGPDVSSGVSATVGTTQVELDITANLEELNSHIPNSTFVGDLLNYKDRTIKTLHKIRTLVYNNDLSLDTINMLRRSLRDFCQRPTINLPKNDLSDNDLASIDEASVKGASSWAISSEVEVLQILLDAKTCGQVRLENNVPPQVKELGKGAFNSVSRVHTKPGVDGGNASGPIAVKPCDRTVQEKSGKTERDFFDALKKENLLPGSMLGVTTGSYGRNKATAGVQAIFDEIGRTKSIEVPHVIATVSAAEMGGTSYIAMEMLDGPTLGEAVKEKKVQFSSDEDKNRFIRRETWMQIQDVLTGQIDRHGDNIMLTGNGPVAIDHDLSFPTNPPRNFAGSVPEVIAKARENFQVAIDGCSNRNYCMPPVIDREMYEVIMAIDLDKLENMYKECGLTNSQITAAISRAKELQEKARQLPDQGRVIEPNQWANSKIVENHCNMYNFYATRHQQGG